MKVESTLWILLPAAGIAGSLMVYRLKSVSDSEKMYRKFRKWISRGRMPEVSMTEVEMASLEDLVDAAIDANERVVYDRDKEVYFFIHGNVLYTYREKV